LSSDGLGALASREDQAQPLPDPGAAGAASALAGVPGRRPNQLGGSLSPAPGLAAGAAVLDAAVLDAAVLDAAAGGGVAAVVPTESQFGGWPGAVSGAGSCHADGARLPRAPKPVAARWSWAAGGQSGTDDAGACVDGAGEGDGDASEDHGVRAAVASHGGTGSADRADAAGA